MINKKRKKLIIILIFLIVAAGAALSYFFWNGGGESPYETVAVKRGSLVQEVSATGKVKPAEEVELAFEKSGRVIGVFAEEGQKVFGGQLLAQLFAADIMAQLDGARANLAIQEATLEELEQGTREEEIMVYEVKVANAKLVLTDAQINLEDKLDDTFTKSDDAVRNKVDQFFDSPRGEDPGIIFFVADSKMKNEAEAERKSMEILLLSWDDALAKQNLEKVKSFLENISFLVNAITSSSGLSQTTIDGWKTDVSTARTNVNTAIVNLTAAEEKLRTAQSALNLAEQELNLKKAGTVEQQVVAQKANVEKALSDIKNYEAQLAKCFIHSPLAGIVTEKGIQVGEIATANEKIFSVISENEFEIKVNIPEIDIGKIALKNSASLTLDAYGSDVVFKAIVVKIDKAETVLEGVSTYGVTLDFLDKDERIKPGMTANLDILTGEKSDILFIPQRAVLLVNSHKIVKVLLDDGAIAEKIVETGLRSSDGNIEITNGLEEGENAVVFARAN